MSRYNPLAVLFGTVVLLVPVLLAFDIVTPLVFAAISLAMYGVAGLKKPLTYAKTILLLSGFALSLVFMNLVVPGKSGDLLYRSIAVFARSMSLVTISVGFIFSVDPYDAVRALMQNLGMPPRMGYSLFAGWNTIPLFMRDTKILRKSTAMRYGNEKIPQGSRLFGASLLLSQAIRHGERAALSMAVRSLDALVETERGGRVRYLRTYVKSVPWRVRDSIFCVVLAVLSAVALLYCIYSGWFIFELG